MAKTLREQLEALDAAEIDAAAARAAEREAPTETSPNQGEGGGVRGFLGDMIEQLGPYGKLDDQIAARQGRQAGAQRTTENTMTGIDKGLSFGLAGTLNAATDTLADRVRGVDGPSFSERRAQSNAQVNENSNFGGEILGAIAGAPRVAIQAAEQGLKKLPLLGELLRTRGMAGLSTRTGTAMGLGATEAGIYSLSQGDTLDEAQSAAMYGALFGGVVQPSAEAVASVVKLLGPVFGNAADLRSSEEIVQLMQTAYGDDFTERLFGNNMFDAQAIADRLTELNRPNATLPELFPDALADQVRLLGNSKNQGVQAATRSLVLHIDNLERMALPEMQQRMAEVLGGDVRTFQQVANEGRVLRQQLQPEYDAALANTARAPSGAGRITGVPVKTVRDRMFSQISQDVFGTNEQLRRRVMSLMPATMRGRRPRQMDARELLQLRQELDGVIYSGRFEAAGDMDAALSVNKAARTGVLLPMRQQVNEILHDLAPDMQRLDNLYGDEITNRHAFEAGMDALKAKNGSDLLDAFTLTAARTPAQMANFLEGVKSQLTEDLTGKSATALQNYLTRAETQGRLRLVEQLAGPDVVQELTQQAQRLAVIRELNRGVNTRIAGNFTDQSTGLGSLGDYALMAGAAGNQLSLALGAGAARRQLAQAGARNASGPTATAGIQGMLLQMPADQAAAAVNQNLMEGVPDLLKGVLGAGAPTGAAMGQE